MSFEAAITSFEDQIFNDVKKDDHGSITAGVVVGNDLIWAKGFGRADIGRQVPADADTIYRVGSITKSFTGVLLGLLCEQEIVRLDDQVEQYFSEIKQLVGYSDYEPITFRQIASHTAGLRREPELLDAASGPIEGWEAKILASLPTTSFEYAPSKCKSYSNIGYGILGLALSRAAEKPYMDLVTDLIFEPLKMKSSAFVLKPDMEEHLATGYTLNGEGMPDAEFPLKEHLGRGYKVPNGGIYSTVGDLGRLIAAQTGASPIQILSVESRAEMQKIQTPESADPGYGLGFKIQTVEDGIHIIGHGGSVAGYNAHLLFEPESEIGVVLLRNYEGGTTDLGQSALDLLRRLVGKTGDG